MGAMTPAERVAFVLHDVFAVPFDEIAQIVGRAPTAVRQLASSARRRVRTHAVRPVDSAAHDEVVRAFARATRNGDLEALAALLDPAVALRSDGGGLVTATRRPVLGVSNVARFIAGVFGKFPGLQAGRGPDPGRDRPDDDRRVAGPRCSQPPRPAVP